MNIDTGYMELRFFSATAAFRRLERLRAVLDHTVLVRDEDLRVLDDQPGSAAVLAEYWRLVGLAQEAHNTSIPLNGMLPHIKVFPRTEVVHETCIRDTTITVVPADGGDWQLELTRAVGAPALDPTSNGRDAMLVAMMLVPDGEMELPSLTFFCPDPNYAQSSKWLEWATEALASM